MILYLVGISCVGKTTIGKLLAEKIAFEFYDLDTEIEKHYNKSIERLQSECLYMIDYRKKGSIVLDKILSNTTNMVVSGVPSGLKFTYLEVYKKHKTAKDLYSIHIKDNYENIVNRLSFYDEDSNPENIVPDEESRKKYIKSIRADYNYFRASYKKADFCIDIDNLSLNEIPDMLIKELQNKIDIPQILIKKRTK